MRALRQSDHRPQSATQNARSALVSLGRLVALQNGQLLSQGEVFESEFALQPEARSSGCKQGVEQAKHGVG